MSSPVKSSKDQFVEPLRSCMGFLVRYMQREFPGQTLFN
jgi:hypothetical protein